MFRKLDLHLFLSSGEGGTPTLLGPLDRANLIQDSVSETLCFLVNTGQRTKSENPVILSDLLSCNSCVEDNIHNQLQHYIKMAKKGKVVPVLD
jgi:hypothetical protein